MFKQDKNPFDTMNKMANMLKARRPAMLGGKGVAMMQYLMAEKEAGNPTRSGTVNPDRLPRETQIHASHPEALKSSLLMLGIKSDYNPDGLPLDIDTARKLFFGEDALSEIEEAEFRASMMNGDKTLDRKRLRQSINFDGSTTVEILNPDKTAKAKFTIGSFKDSKVFAQGGYDEYANELRNILSEGRKQTKAQMEFAELQSKMMMTDKEREKRFGGEETIKE